VYDGVLSHGTIFIPSSMKIRSTIFQSIKKGMVLSAVKIVKLG
jgi:hypothetical protein